MKLTDKVGVYFTQENDSGTINRIEYKQENKGVIKTEIPVASENYEIDYIEELDELNATEPENDITEILPAEDEIEIKVENRENNNTTIQISDEPENKPKLVKYRIVQNRKTRYLDANNWVKTTLTEEEAISEFQMKCLDPTYMKSPYKCEDCFRGFSKEEMYNRHFVLRHNESLGDYVCKLCKMRFKWQSHLRLHMKKHYNKYQCQRCHFVCSLEHTALAHEEYHSGVVKKCMHCGEEFRHISTYYTHIRNVHRSEYICTYCGASFVSEAGLHQHKKVKHFDVDLYPQDSPDDDEDVKTYCERCDITFHTRKAYDEHKFHSVMHSEGIKDKKLDDITIPRKALGKRVRSVANRQSQISSQDGTTVVVPQGKRTKRDKRPKAIPTTCHQCGEHFPTQTACMRHHLAEHPGTSFYPPTARYICDICGASLAPGSVAVHQNLHSREKKYPCPTCNKIFHSTVGLKRHLITHTGEKRYGCTLCDKRFTQSNSMKLHYRTFHLKQPYPKRNRDKKKKLLGRLHSNVMVDIEECERDEGSAEELEGEVIEIPIEEHAVAVQYLNNYN
ncbi:Zinc finger protein 189 [Eumeta japonica]|uniref:Zinc finger protein 189 n=1 Tax=Eumeta variegata TaxID=151549 RepID=A0A4C1U3M1_EUMVA|nr:Zinc finger protein 189 [Eumeta japonica]